MIGQCKCARADANCNGRHPGWIQKLIASLQFHLKICVKIVRTNGECDVLRACNLVQWRLACHLVQWSQVSHEYRHVNA